MLRLFINAIKEGITTHMIYDKMTLLQAIKEEIHMITRVMGIKCYINYHAGTAIEGVDFNC